MGIYKTTPGKQERSKTNIVKTRAIKEKINKRIEARGTIE